jgi:hypothetical protein
MSALSTFGLLALWFVVLALPLLIAFAYLAWRRRRHVGMEQADETRAKTDPDRRAG